MLLMVCEDSRSVLQSREVYPCAEVVRGHNRAPIRRRRCCLADGKPSVREGENEWVTESGGNKEQVINVQQDHRLRLLMGGKLYLGSGRLPYGEAKKADKLRKPERVPISASMHNCATVIGAADLSGRPDSQTNAITAEEGCLGTTVAAKIEVDIGSVLVGARETVLSAQWVSICGAEVVDHDNDRCASIGERVS